MHTSKSDAARAEMAAAAPALAAVPREPVAKEQQVEEPVAEQVVNIVSVRQQCRASAIASTQMATTKRKRWLTKIGRSVKKK